MNGLAFRLTAFLLIWVWLYIAETVSSYVVAGPVWLVGHFFGLSWKTAQVVGLVCMLMASAGYILRKYMGSNPMGLLVYAAHALLAVIAIKVLWRFGGIYVVCAGTSFISTSIESVLGHRALRKKREEEDEAASWEPHA